MIANNAKFSDHLAAILRSAGLQPNDIVKLEFASTCHGGKAVGLAKLCSYQIPVPNGLALSPEAARFIANSVQSHVVRNLADAIVASLSTRPLAVRSSAVDEDGQEQSFAGIYESILNVAPDTASLVAAIKQVYSGADSARVTSYKQLANEKREDSLPHLGIVIQEMIQPAVSGVAFSRAISVDGKDVILLECCEGLADKVVGGLVRPTRVEIPLSDQSVPLLEESTIFGRPIDLSSLTVVVGLINSAVKNAQINLDIEWAVDKDHQAWLLQARPITRDVLVPHLSQRQSVGASPGRVSGNSFVVESESDLPSFPKGGILVATVTDTNYLPAMRRAAAIVTEEGGILSHAAIVSREIGIPCVVGCDDAKARFPTGTEISVDGHSGLVDLTERPKGEGISVVNRGIDWGAAYVFEQIIPIKIDNVVCLFDPTPTGLVLHVPGDLDVKIDSKFERYSRLNFSSSPRRYQSDKYLWFFEWKRFSSNPHFARSYQDAALIVATLDEGKLEGFYVDLVERGKALRNNSSKFDDDGSKFLVQETLVGIHFLLTMIVPEGIALRTLYSNTAGRLAELGLSFPEFISGDIRVFEHGLELAAAVRFLQSLQKVRNSVYTRLRGEDFIREDYFDIRYNAASLALKSLNLVPLSGEDPIDCFYRNIEKIPVYSTFVQ